MTSETLIEFDRVQKAYGRHLVIKDLNLRVRRGEFLTLLGASGSGKTTSLMMLAGFEEPTRGEIRMNGVPIEHVPPHRRGIGVVFQNYALFPHMSVAQNLAYPLRMRGMSRSEIEAGVKRAVAMVRLQGMEERKPAMLSGGQQQRVALARALIFRPELVLMDEPLGALDKNLREHMQFEIKELHRQLGVTVVYVTHDQSEALTMSDRVAIFHNGDVVQIAPPGDIYEKPADAYVAGFVGENNLIEVTVDGHEGDGARVLLPSGQSVTVPSPLAEGARAILAVRPEKLRIGAEAEGLGLRVGARVTEVVYLGDQIRALLDFGAGQIAMVKLPVAASSRPQVGDQIMVGCDPADTRLFPEP
ncbi:ABC transporter ATP-binding protein [Ancylobacter sp.]|uniref:ABC transporter ATP-binding protein n=1 Tax=Ancylobacter sp. TaxID=1872567 RepID=UPI003C7C3159